MEFQSGPLGLPLATPMLDCKVKSQHNLISFSFSFGLRLHLLISSMNDDKESKKCQFYWFKLSKHSMSFIINKRIGMICGKKVFWGPPKNLRGPAVGNHWCKWSNFESQSERNTRYKAFLQKGLYVLAIAFPLSLILVLVGNFQCLWIYNKSFFILPLQFLSAVNDVCRYFCKKKFSKAFTSSMGVDIGGRRGPWTPWIFTHSLLNLLNFKSSSTFGS